jgi:hypothetical protein
MQLAWIFRALSNQKREESCLTKAAGVYEGLFQGGGDLPKKLGVPGVLFLLGDIHRRLRCYDKARYYYSRTLQTKELKSYPLVERRVREAIMLSRMEEEQRHQASAES